MYLHRFLCGLLISPLLAHIPELSNATTFPDGFVLEHGDAEYSDLSDAEVYKQLEANIHHVKFFENQSSSVISPLNLKYIGKNFASHFGGTHDFEILDTVGQFPEELKKAMDTKEIQKVSFDMQATFNLSSETTGFFACSERFQASEVAHMCGRALSADSATGVTIITQFKNSVLGVAGYIMVYTVGPSHIDGANFLPLLSQTAENMLTTVIQWNQQDDVKKIDYFRLTLFSGGIFRPLDVETEEVSKTIFRAVADFFKKQADFTLVPVLQFSNAYKEGWDKLQEAATTDTTVQP